LVKLYQKKGYKMAEEKKEEEKEETEGKKSDGGNKLILIIIVILLLLLLVIGGLVAYFLLVGDNPKENPNNPNNPQAQNQKVEQKAEVKKDTSALEIGPIYPLDPFTVNLKSASGTRYLKCTINLEIDSPETQPELDKIKPAVRDVIIRILSSKTVPEISTAKGKEKLKEELKKNINAILPKGEIKHVYFTAFVIQ
jgi:flagellar FliL protein